MDRFTTFDTALGLPYRELVGCLLWVVLCVVGPELVRVKDLARRSNHPSPADYQTALKVLRRIYIRRHVVIRFEKGSAGKEWVPSSDVRPDLTSPDFKDVPAYAEDDFSLYPVLTEAQLNLAIPPIPLPTNPRFSQVAFTDASFAVGDLKMSITGLIVYVNCTPILWASIKQTTIADSSCAAEFVGASVCAKQMTHVENMCHFLGFTCPKPYPVYTDSQASLSIASNSIRLGKVRHIAIRYHLVRAMVQCGDIKMIFCYTEDMIADLLTKILIGTTYDRLAFWFYFLGFNPAT
jgi:hypothetical protein